MLHQAALEPHVWTELPPPVGAQAKKERGQVEAMVSALESSGTDGARAARRLLWGDGMSEVSLTWTDDQTGLHRRARLDRLIVRAESALVVDLKSTDDPSPEAFSKSIHKFGYHRQAAYYIDAAREYVGDGCSVSFAFVAIRKDPPHEVVVYQLDAEAIDIGKREIDEAMRGLVRSLAVNEWSAPWEREATVINLPAWARKRGAA
jgi:predicted RNA methylase